MPFSKKKKDESANLSESAYEANINTSSLPEKKSQEKEAESKDNNKPKLVFHCQLAHGSPTGLIS